MSVSVGIYVRLSDEDRNKLNKGDESESIQNQKSMLTEFCRERNWEIYDIYNDEDYSGTDKHRPEFNRMIKDCENGCVNLVLCKHQDRFARDNELVNHYIHGKFIEWGVRFKSVIDHIDTSDENTKKQSQISFVVNGICALIIHSVHICQSAEICDICMPCLICLEELNALACQEHLYIHQRLSICPASEQQIL